MAQRQAQASLGEVGSWRALRLRPSAWLIALTCGGLLAACAGPSGNGPRGAMQPLESVDTVSLDIAQDMRYHGANNFMGRPVAGYDGARCWLSRPALLALVAAQRTAMANGLRIKVYDCYRPQRAVDDFVRWGKDLMDQSTKPAYYPNVPKDELFTRGYIAERSGHSRASTVDMGLQVIDADRAARVLQGELVAGQDVDMGTPFDLFDERSHTESALVDATARHNRLWLRAMMDGHGWRNLPEEWWHFTLRDEPFPDTYFDLPVR